MMINQHDFNTKWWGSPVGIVKDTAFFLLSREEQAEMLKPFRWVEFACSILDAPQASVLHDSGFFQSDTQVSFRIGLRKVPSTESLEAFEVRFADEATFQVRQEDTAPFLNERFILLPGATQQIVDARYILWSNRLIEENPSLCMQLIKDGKVQGWFLSRRDERGSLNLTLAMLSREAEASGMHLYQKALNSYAGRGDNVGWASFSVTNTAVHNMYSALGARFLAPTGCWFWINQEG